MKPLNLFLFLLMPILLIGQTNSVSVIPQPNQVTLKEGVFTHNGEITLSTNNPSLQQLADYTTTLLKDDFNWKVSLTTIKKNANLKLVLDDKYKANEAYKLVVDKNGIEITAANEQGLFYGLQTLGQLVDKNNATISYLEIEDAPRFGWRAFMLDEARYFQGKEQVMKLLDEMARLKMNIFHWHLVDDQGWRIEIKKYPLLTEIGSKRKSTQVGPRKWQSPIQSGVPHEGFYTQNEIKEIIKYAQERHITIVPEIEMPGHSSAAIAAYPWLGSSGKKIEVPINFGVSEDIYNIADPKVYDFLTDVLDEVIALFPSKVIHIGGDEAKYEHWESSVEIKNYMKENNLKTFADLQVDFTNKISQYIESKGRKMMGWNEILGQNIHEYQADKDAAAEVELSKSSIIHFWRGDIKLMTQAATEGYNIVNSLHSETYLDYSYQDISLERAYNFDPIPAELEEQFHNRIIGTGSQMWGEWIPTSGYMDYMVFPRIAAYAEVGWTQPKQKNFDRFLKSLPSMLDVWKSNGIYYAPLNEALPAKDKENKNASLNIPILPDELWWGGAVNDGFNMPYQEGFSYNMYGDNKGNQVQPLLISNKGRVIWSEEPFEFTFQKNAISITDIRGEILQSTSGKTLKEAVDFASKNYFPADGKMPHELLFSAPQYNTWIELMYDQNQKDILAYAHAIIDNGFPPGVLMIDDNWQENYGKWDFHPKRFPDPKAMIKELHNLGFKVMLWVCPFVSPDSDVYRDLAKQGLFLKNAEDAKVSAAPWIKPDQPAMIYWWNGASAVLDLSNPKAEAWFKGKLNRLVEEYNVDGFKLDAGDSYFYPDHLISYVKGTTPNEQSELFGKIGLDYPLNEYRAMWKMAGKPLAQRLSDKAHNWNDLQMLIPNITSQGLMGYAFSCPDMIGGGEFKSFLDTETIDQDLIVRSAQIHALMPMMQFSVAPWRILDKEHLDAVKQAIELRKKFTPYIMQLTKEAAKTGKPIVRTMEYEFPNQGFEKSKDQFMLGDKLLVAPVLKKGTKERTVKLPKGRWKSVSDKKYRGGRTVTVKVALTTLPYFERIR